MSSLGIYGKLPVSREFIRQDCHEGSRLVFRDWVDQGCGAIDEGDRRVLGEGVRRRWLFAPPDEAPLAAITLGSNDASGHRRFPFFVFSDVAVDRIEATGVFSQLAEPWETLEGELDRLLKCEDGEQLRDAAREIFVDLEGSLRARPAYAWEDFRDYSARKWILHLYAEDAPGQFVRALWRLQYVGDHLKSMESPSLRAIAVRVPMASSVGFEVQADFWREVLALVHPLFRRVPSGFLPAPSNAPTHAALIYRAPTVDDLAVAFGRPPQRGQVIDLASNSGTLPTAGYPDFVRHLGKLLQPQAVTVGELLEGITFR